MSNSHLDAVFDNYHAMSDISCRLQQMAASFDVVGNEKVAEKLWDIAEEVRIWAHRVRDTHGEKLSEDLQRSQEATANILIALVSGIEMGKKDK